MKNLNNYINLHKDEIGEFLTTYLSKKEKEDHGIPLYTDALKRLSEFATSGKAMRGILIMGATEMFGHDAKEAINIAAAIELVHSALLIHDDIIDDDYLRRGKKTIFAQYEENENSKFYGQSMAICVGDIAFFLAYELISSSEISNESKNKLISYFSGELQKVGAAEMEDFHFGATND